MIVAACFTLRGHDTHIDLLLFLFLVGAGMQLPACRRLLFPLLHAEKERLRNAVVVPFPRATKEIGDVCTQASMQP